MMYMADIIYRDNVRFPDTGLIDLDIHPTINISKNVNNRIFFIGVTSINSPYSRKLDKKYKYVIKPIPGTPINRPSIAKLDHVLVEDYKYRNCNGGLDPHIYEDMICKLHGLYENYNGNCGGKYCGCNEYNIEINNDI